ncbi:MAG: UDP-N-acetylglucosamine--N-acetylmuramyl-(pentapeptide) pyrophosphoryl-undecaprenol N-acetylglucosamine transferase [bacterium]|nr:UDP-N-acetylglucosamine--N-acetylmuramyl-(pentapeptide) pyrophosphoryl-undecaprenol N-acetylglucosamine transferase [bacterium]
MSAIHKFRIAYAGGASGGHIYPLAAVTHTLRAFLQERGVILDAKYFGSPGTFRVYLDREGIKIAKVMSSKWRTYASIKNLFEPFKFMIGFVQAMFKLFFFMPDALFSKGGPGALAVVLAARWYRIPVVVHESDAVPGRTNLKSAKHAAVVDLSFEEAAKYFPPNVKIRVVGSPVRKHLVLEESPATSRLSFGLPDGLPVLLFLGGSQGAQALNDFVLESSEILLASFAIIHQVGPNNFKDYKVEYDFMSKNHDRVLKQRYYITPYLNDRDMAAALNASDIVVSRAGSSIFELAAAGKPAILVPLPDSANDHQRENAYSYSNAGAAIVIEQDNLKEHLFIQQVEKLMRDENGRQRMAMAAGSYYKADAAERIVEDILSSSDLAKYFVNTEVLTG